MVEEDWNKYLLDDGSLLRVRAAALRVIDTGGVMRRATPSSP